MANIDIHVHVFGDNNKEDGCIMSSKLETLCRLGSAAGFLVNLPFSLNDEDIRNAILEEIRNSKLVDKAVLLAFDKPRDNKGQPLKPVLYAANSWVAKICKENPNIALFGASVHPYREDALDELHRVKEEGAVLVKWIPSSQNILPSHEKWLIRLERTSLHECP